MSGFKFDAVDHPARPSSSHWFRNRNSGIDGYHSKCHQFATGCLPLADGKLWRLAKAPSKEYFEQNSGAILRRSTR